jgi:hypothetical protein
MTLDVVGGYRRQLEDGGAALGLFEGDPCGR